MFTGISEECDIMYSGTHILTSEGCDIMYSGTCVLTYQRDAMLCSLVRVY